MSAEIAEILLRRNAVILKTNPPFRWSSGLRAPIYTDNRVLMSYPKERSAVIDSFISLIEKNKISVDGFAGTATAGIPWAAWLAQKLDTPMVYVRKESKGYGRDNQIEGVIEKGKKYVVVEDLISTGGSSVTTIAAVRNAGGVVEHCIAIFTYELSEAHKNFSDAKTAVHTLTDFTALVKTAAQKKYISAQQTKMIDEWKENPKLWSERMG